MAKTSQLKARAVCQETYLHGSLKVTGAAMPRTIRLGNCKNSDTTIAKNSNKYLLIMNNTQIFLSYAWGGESEKIVNELDNAFQEKGITLIRDKRDLGFKGMITDFMQKIGEGNVVVTVISDKYLKSPYCMFELLEIYRNLNFKERIFPIVLGDANVFDPLPRLQYLKHWQDKKKELDDAIMQFGIDAITVIGDDYKIYKKIFDNFGEVVNILKEINSLTPEMHREDNFKTLINTVADKSKPQKQRITKKKRIKNHASTHRWKEYTTTVKKQCSNDLKGYIKCSISLKTN